MQSSRTAVYVNAFVGLVLFGFIMYPVLSSAEGLRDNGMMRKDEAQERMDDMREERSEKLEALRGEWHKRFGALADEQKAKIAEHLADQMNALNETLTNHYLAFLDHLSTVVGKIETRVTELGTGANTADVVTKISAAKASIETAHNAVIVQQGKLYDVTFTTQDKLRDAFQKVKKQLQDDHTALRAKITTAKQAVQDAVAALKLLVTE